MSLSSEKHPPKKWCPKIIINNKRRKKFGDIQISIFFIKIIPNFIRNVYILLLNALGIFKIIVKNGITSCHGHRIF
jgi:hypothetical protein